MQLHNLAFSYVSLHAVPWACMQFHELVCSSFLRLSSSQEFCSACLRRHMFEMLQEQPQRDREWPGAVLSRGRHVHYFWSEETKKYYIFETFSFAHFYCPSISQQGWRHWPFTTCLTWHCHHRASLLQWRQSGQPGLEPSSLWARVCDSTPRPHKAA